MRNNQADKPDITADTNGGSSSHGRYEKQTHAEGGNRHTNSFSFRFAQHQNVQVTCQQAHNNNTAQHRSHCQIYMLPTTVIKTADHPEKILLQLLLVHKSEQAGGNSTQKHTHGNTCQKQRHNRNFAVTHCQKYRQAHSTDTAAKGKCRHSKHTAGGCTQSNRKHRTGSSTGGDTDKTGVCQRITENALHYSAGNTQRRTYKHTYKHTRQANIPDNSKLLSAVISLGKAGQIQLRADNCQRLAYRHIYLTKCQRYTCNNN